MGWVMMSERELNRIEILAQINDGRLSVMDGALAFAGPVKTPGISPSYAFS